MINEDLSIDTVFDICKCLALLDPSQRNWFCIKYIPAIVSGGNWPSKSLCIDFVLVLMFIDARLQVMVTSFWI
jgi:hypothetical protein